MRSIISHDPFLEATDTLRWGERGLWPCSWIASPSPLEPPFVTAYRLRFDLEQASRIRIHVSADERYELFLDGARVGRGPERGDPDNWFYETYDLDLNAGAHVLVARVWTLGDLAAHATMSVHPGFILAAEEPWLDLLSTGRGAWEVKQINGYSFIENKPAFWREARVQIDGQAYPWGVERGEGDGWETARTTKRGLARLIYWDYYRQHRLQPAILPPMLDEPRSIGTVRLVADVPGFETYAVAVRAADMLSDEQSAWQGFIRGEGEITVPANTRRRVLIDLDDYYCAYPEIMVSSGAGSTVRISWVEALVTQPKFWFFDKGNRDEIEGKFVVGVPGDVFLVDGGEQRQFSPLWWQAGRYVELVVETGESPLILHRLTLRETRYPLEMESQFNASDPKVNRLMPMLTRVMQVGLHEIYTDSPYFEEMMYTCDTAIESLNTYVMTRDDRPPRKALRLYDSSRLPNGMTQSRYPCRITQIIAPFALFWVGMVSDYAYWRDDADYVRNLLPGTRATLEGFRRFIGKEGLLHPPDGWNIIDGWAGPWEKGERVPMNGIGGVQNWQLIYTLTVAADLEAQLGEPELATYYRRWAADMAERAVARFWDEDRGLLSNDAEHQEFSEHTQCFALLSGLLDPEKHERVAHGLVHAEGLARASYHFCHFLFDTYYRINRPDAFIRRLDDWLALADKGLKTTVESPEPTRSDCHAWSAHPLYHFFASTLGIRPASAGFATVRIAPQLGSLTSASGTMVHPRGEIVVDLRVEGGQTHGTVTLPDGVTGVLVINGGEHQLPSGQFTF